MGGGERERETVGTAIGINYPLRLCVWVLGGGGKKSVSIRIKASIFDGRGAGGGIRHTARIYTIDLRVEGGRGGGMRGPRYFCYSAGAHFKIVI